MGKKRKRTTTKKPPPLTQAGYVGGREELYRRHADFGTILCEELARQPGVTIQDVAVVDPIDPRSKGTLRR